MTPPAKIVKRFCVDCHREPDAACTAEGSGTRAHYAQKAKACGCVRCRGAAAHGTGGHRAYYEVVYVLEGGSR